MVYLTDSAKNWLLPVGVFLPVVGILVLAVIPRAEEQLMKIVALLTALATAAIGIVTLASFDYDRAGTLQFYVNEPWIDAIHSRFIMGCDGMSLPLYILTMVITLMVIIYSWNHIPEPGNPKAFFILILILQVGMAGTFVAQDLILFFVFFEVVLLPMYFMIGVWGGEQRRYASLKFFLFTLFGSAFMLLAFIALFFKTDGQSAPNGFSIEYLMAHSSSLTRTTALADLRRHVPRLRHQGADVPVPHLAAGRPHPGADRGFGDPGCHPPEAGHVRVHPDRHPDPAVGGQGVGAMDRRARGHRHHHPSPPIHGAHSLAADGRIGMAIRMKP